MVYESDYSTRRIYSSAGSRPGITTSYSYSPGPVYGLQQPFVTPMQMPYSDQLVYVPCIQQPPMQMQYAPAPIQVDPPLLPFVQHHQHQPTAVVTISPYTLQPLLPFVQHHQHQPTAVVTISPYTLQGRSYNGLLPKIAHQRLAVVSSPPRSLSPARVQSYYDELQQDQVGAFGGGYNYIIVNVAPSAPPRRRALPTSKITYIEDVTDSNNLQTLARETRMMRRDADNLLIRLNEGLPPPMFSLRSIPLRSSGDLREAIDIRRRYVHERNNPHIPYSNVRNNVYRMSMYQDPDKYQLRGQGNLACLSYAGGRPIPKRRRFYPEDKIRDDVNFRSFYFKLRDAANYEVYQPLYRSQKTIMGALSDEPKRERKVYESKWVTRALAKDDAPTPPPRKSSATSSPRQGVSVTLPGPRKSVVEPAEVTTKVVNVPEEKIVVKIPKNEEDLPVAYKPAEVEETVKVPSATTKSEPPPAEPEPVPAPVEQPAPAEVKEEPVVEAKSAPVEAAAPPEPTAQSPPEAAAPPKEEPTPAVEPTPAPATPAPAEEPKVEEPAPVPVVEAPAPEPAKEPETVAEAPAAEAAPAASPAEDATNKGEEIEVIEEPVVEEDVNVHIDEGNAVDDVCEVQIEENDLEIDNQSAVDEPGLEAEELQQSESKCELQQSEQNQTIESEQNNQIHESEQNEIHELEQIEIQELEQIEIQESEQNPLQESAQNPTQESEINPIQESEINPIQESEQNLILESEINIAHESEQNIDSIPEPEPEPVELEPEQTPCAEEDTTAAEVSIVVADIDGPIASEPQDVELDAPLTVEEIQANAERRRTEFAKLLEEHAEIVGTVQRLESDGGVQEAAAAENEI